MVVVKKRQHESATSLMYRFNKKIRQSGVIREVRNSRFYGRPTSKRVRRLSALHRDEQKKEFLRKKKLGIETNPRLAK